MIGDRKPVKHYIIKLVSVQNNLGYCILNSKKVDVLISKGMFNDFTTFFNNVLSIFLQFDVIFKVKT